MAFQYTERPLSDFETYERDKPVAKVPGPSAMEQVSGIVGITKGVESALSKIDERRNKRLIDARLFGERVDPDLTFQYMPKDPKLSPEGFPTNVTENIFSPYAGDKGRWRNYLRGGDDRMIVNPKYLESGGTLTKATKAGLQTGVDPNIIRGATGFGPDPRLGRHWSKNLMKRTTPSIARMPSGTDVYKRVNVTNPYTGKVVKPRTNFVELPKSNIGVKYQPPSKGLGGKLGGFGSKFGTGQGKIAEAFKSKFIPQKGVAQGPGMQVIKALKHGTKAAGGTGFFKTLFPKAAAKAAGTTAATGASTGLLAGMGPAGWAMMALSLLGGKLFKKHTLLGKIFSDERLKKNIKYVGKSPSGVPIVDFEYVDGMNIPGIYRGVLSKHVPHAKESHPTYGFDIVDYRKVDVEFSRIG